MRASSSSSSPPGAPGTATAEPRRRRAERSGGPPTALQRLTVLGEKEQAALTNTAHKCSMWEIFEAGGEQNPPSGEIDADFGARRSK